MDGLTSQIDTEVRLPVLDTPAEMSTESLSSGDCLWLPVIRMEKRRDDSGTAGAGPPQAGQTAPLPESVHSRPNRPARSEWADVTGTAPEGIRIDPDITEGHPGYEESGESEIIPVERLRKGEAAPDKS